VSAPNQIPKLDFSELGAAFNQHYSNMIDRVNSMMGWNGTIQVADHLDLGGKRIMNVGAPVEPADALSSAVAQKNYSASALKPQLQSGGSQSLDTYRQMNNSSQREQSSSFLNDLMSSPPNANAIVPLTSASLTAGFITSSTLGFAGTSGYTTHTGLPTTTSGSGTGATSNIVASGGMVTSGSAAGGVNYSVGDKVFPTQAGSSADAYFLVVAVTNTGNVSVTIPASLFTFADGSSVSLMSRTDLLPLPNSYGISSISSVGNVVTVVTYSPTGLSAGQSMTISGVTPSSFNGSFPTTSVTPPYQFTYQEDLGTVSGSGGTVDLHNCYYYAVQKRQNFVTLLGPFNGDTAENRLNANFDGYQIVAVVVLTNSGGNVASSGGGGSVIVGSPTAGAFF
jgi:hypothetical protein